MSPDPFVYYSLDTKKCVAFCINNTNGLQPQVLKSIRFGTILMILERWKTRLGDNEETTISKQTQVETRVQHTIVQ